MGRQIDDYEPAIRSQSVVTPPATAQPFSRNCAWTTRDLTASYPLPGETINLRRWTLVQKDHDAVLLAPYQTTMWRNYTVTADLGGFTHPGDGTTAGLVALAGAPQYQVEVTIRVGEYHVHQAFDNPRVVASGTLPQQPRTRSTSLSALTLSPSSSTDAQPFDLPIPPLGRHLPAGGISGSGTRLYPDKPPPQFANLTVR